MSVGDIYELRVVTDVSGELCYNRLHWVLDSEPTPDIAEASDLLAEFEASILTPFWLDLLGDNSTIIYRYARRIWPNPGIPAVVASNLTGTAGSQSCPASTALCFSLYAGALSRRDRGRFWLSGLAEAWQSAGSMEQVGMNVANNMAAALLVIPSPADPGDIIWSLVVRNGIFVGSSDRVQLAVANTNLRIRRSRTQHPGIAND